MLYIRATAIGTNCFKRGVYPLGIAGTAVAKNVIAISNFDFRSPFP